MKITIETDKVKRVITATPERWELDGSRLILIAEIAATINDVVECAKKWEAAISES